MHKVDKVDEAYIAKLYRPERWNAMTVSAHGGRIVVHVNGMQTAELIEDPGRKEGRVALQLHGNQDVDIRFKAIEILASEAR